MADRDFEGADVDIVLSQRDLDEMLEGAAHRGALIALRQIGLGDIEAVHDVKDLRGILGAYRDAKQTAWRTFIRFIVTMILGFIVIGSAIKLELGDWIKTVFFTAAR